MSNSKSLEPRMSAHPPFTAQVSGSLRLDGEGVPRRNILTSSALVSQPTGEGQIVATVYDIVKRASILYHGKPALGTRKLIKKHLETKMVKVKGREGDGEKEKKWTLYEMGPYEYVTYGEYAGLVGEMGSALRALGLGRGDMVHLFASTG